MIRIVINKTSSKKYQDVISLSKDLGGTVTKDGINILILDSKIIQSIDELTKLANITSSLKNIECFLNKKKTNLYRLMKHLGEIHQCSSSFSVIDKKYCWINTSKEGWGCKFIDSPCRHLAKSNVYSNDKYWYNFGKYKDDNVWSVNKALIIHKIANTVKDKSINICPYFKHTKVMDIIGSFPDTIVPDGVFFQKYYMEDFDGEKISAKPINIRHVLIKSKDELMEEKRKGLIRKYELQIASGELYGINLKKAVNALRMLRSNHYAYDLNIHSDIPGLDNITFSEN